MSLTRSVAPSESEISQFAVANTGGNLLQGIREACRHRVRPGLELLLDAANYASNTGLPLRAFAVDVSTLSLVGLLHVDLLWLTHRGYLVSVCDNGLSPLLTGTVHLTLAGVSAVNEFLDGVLFASVAVPVAVAPLLCTPVWDENRRELRWGDRLVKRFRVPAPNQELILCAFQEEGWPPHIDDPLPHSHGVEPKRRLHDTIVALNRHRTAEQLRFSGDGRGLGVAWSVSRDIS